LSGIVDDDVGGVLADLSRMAGAVAAGEAEHRAQGTEHSEGRQGPAADHISIIDICGRAIAADPVGHHSRT
jgi:hypothetical protein